MLYETSENHKVEALVTRWYANSYKDVKAAVLNVAKKLNFTLINANDEYQELLFDGMNYDVIIKVTSNFMYESGVDLTVNKKVFFVKKPIFLIEQFYDELQKTLNFKGKGLFANGQ